MKDPYSLLRSELVLYAALLEARNDQIQHLRGEITRLRKEIRNANNSSTPTSSRDGADQHDYQFQGGELRDGDTA